MLNHVGGKHFQAFVEILFLRLRSDNLRQLSRRSRVLLYIAALIFFYLPIVYFVVQKCLDNRSLIVFFVLIALIHVLAKTMLCKSKKIQHRFSTIKRRKHFLIRTWLIVEYVVFMWLVYLLYPLTCIFIPFSLLSMSFESMLGYSAIFDLLMQYSEQFILFGGIISYILFIVADGYRKLRAGFLPDYLGLYAILTVISATIEGATQKLLEHFSIDLSQFTSTLSRIFALSNDAMTIVASVMTFFFAVYSLYTNCGTGVTEETKEQAQPEPENDDDT